MSTSLTAPLVQTIRLQGDYSHILQLWCETYLNEPYVAIKEYISNSLNNTIDRDNKPCHIHCEQGTIVIYSANREMNRGSLAHVLSKINIKSSPRETYSIGHDFTYDGLSAFVLANRVELTNHKDNTDGGLCFNWVKGKSHMQLLAVEMERSGNRISFFLKEKLMHLANPHLIRGYIARVFGLLRRPIYIRGINEVINPASYWLESSVRHAENQQKTQTELLDPSQSSSLLQQYFPQHHPTTPYLSTDQDASRIILSIPQHPEEDSKPQLFRKGVLVGESDKHLLPKSLRFLKVMVDSPHFELSVMHDHVKENDRTLNVLPNILCRQVYHYFSLLANEQPQLLQDLLYTHREKILPYASKNHNWRVFLARHYPLYNQHSFINWNTLKEKLKAYASQARLALINSKTELTENYHAILISNEDQERDFIRLLAADSLIAIEEPDQNDPVEKENAALRLYCLSLLHTVSKQLKALGTEDDSLAQLSWVCAQITPNNQ